MFQSKNTKREWIWIKRYWPLLSKQQQNSSFSFGEMLHNQRKTEGTKQSFSFANIICPKVNVVIPLDSLLTPTVCTVQCQPLKTKHIYCAHE